MISSGLARTSAVAPIVRQQEAIIIDALVSLLPGGTKDENRRTFLMRTAMTLAPFFSSDGIRALSAALRGYPELLSTTLEGFLHSIICDSV